MWCGVITIFPQLIDEFKSCGIIQRALKDEKLTIEVFNLRDFATDKHRTVDDRPYGGGPGMVMLAGPLKSAIDHAKSVAPSLPKVVYLSPAGEKFTHIRARQLADEMQPLLFICGRYEGVDQRIIDNEVDAIISIGDYVLSGGELAAMVVIEALSRWVPDVVGCRGSVEIDAFSEENQGILDSPHYSRPAIFENSPVPKVLLEGDHKAINRWRSKQALGQTWLHRKDLLENLNLSSKQQQLLDEYQTEFYKEN